MGVNNAVDGFLKAACMASGNEQNDKIIHRKVFYECCKWIESGGRRYLILTGPRKCGKTVCINQLKVKYGTEKYYDFKSIKTVDERNRVFEEEILAAKEGLFLLDEITYLPGYMSQLAALDNSVVNNLVNGIKDTRKFIITGSHSYAIQNAVMLALSTNATYLQTSFVDFEEWLLWRGRISEYGQEYLPTASDFKDYVCNSNLFTKIDNNTDYIKSCLEETVVCELNLHSAISGMVPSESISAETVLSVLYSFLAKLHKKATIKTLQNPVGGIIASRISNSDVKQKVKQSELEIRVNEVFEYLRSNKVPNNFESIRTAIILLQQLDLITITVPLDSLDNKVLVNCGLSDISRICDIQTLLSRCNVCVKHPMFYANMIKELIPEIGEDYYNVIDQTILGSILECHLKGLFSYKLGTDILYSYEYYIDDEQGEVDLISFDEWSAYEFSVSSNHTLKHLKRLDVHWNCVLVSGQESERFEDLIYYEYYPNTVLKLSRGNFVKRLRKLKW